MKYEVKCPKCSTVREYKPRNKLPKDPHTTCSKCGYDIRVNDNTIQKKIRENTPKEKVIEKSQSFTPPTTGEIVQAVDDPVGFVTGIITEELMKTRDVRWATLFVSVLRESKKLDYNTQKEIEWSNQAKQLSISDLVEKVAIKGSISRSTSRRLEKADDTSQYDSFLDV